MTDGKKREQTFARQTLKTCGNPRPSLKPLNDTEQVEGKRQKKHRALLTFLSSGDYYKNSKNAAVYTYLPEKIDGLKEELKKTFMSKWSKHHFTEEVVYDIKYWLHMTQS